MPEEAKWNTNERGWVLWDKPILPMFVEAFQDESQTSPVTGVNPQTPESSL